MEFGALATWFPNHFKSKIRVLIKAFKIWDSLGEKVKLDLEELSQTTSENPFVKKFEQFFKTELKKDITKLATHYPENKSLVIDFTVLSNFDYKLAEELLANPDIVTEAAEIALKDFDIPNLEIDEFKPNVRFTSLPKDGKTNPLIRYISSSHLNKMILVDGIVRQVSDVLPKLLLAVYECRRCGNIYKIIQEKRQQVAPVVCECKHRDFHLLEDKSRFIDSQKVQVQEPIELIKGGEQASFLDVYLIDDLVNKVGVGSRVEITGMLRLLPPKDPKDTVYRRYFESNFVVQTEKEFAEIDVSEEDEKEIRALASKENVYELLVQSLAPNIYGHEMVKEAIILQMFGGTKKVMPDKTNIRGNIHVLLVGDPGCLIGDERVVLGNGAIVRLEKLGQTHLQEIKTQMLTGQGKKRDWATCFHTYQQQPIISVTTESGKNIQGTFNHPLLTVHNRKREWKRLDELKPGDYLATVPSIPCTITAPIETNFEHYQSRLGPRTKTKLPKLLTKDLAGFLGYITGDGWVTKYKVGFDVNSEEQDLLPKLEKIVEENFGLKARARVKKIENKKPITEVEINSLDLAFNLKFLREKRMPELILQSGNEALGEYLSWLFEADGCVFSKGRGKNAIQLKAKNIELLRDVQIALLRFSIHARIVENNLQIRRAESMEKFANKIGFQSEKKKTRLKTLIENVSKFSRKWHQQRSERIVKIELAGVQNVFDVEIPKTHRFIANGIVSHNTAKSSLCLAADRIAPKSVYVAGKMASGAGIAAAAVKDEYGDGGWVIKAGALVLANGGMAIIDELDKMDPEDRSALHEAMEQGSTSIAKAGIVTRFKTETSILGAANPKFGRFDEYENPLKQINLPPTLMSRFDLYFVIRDVLDKTKDTEIASHILRVHQSSQKLMQSKLKDKKMSKKQIEEIEAQIMPKIGVELIKKYIAYSRQKCFPILEDSAIKKISDFYVGLREEGRQKGGVFTATHRQLEALIRLSEASAKVKLKDKVEEEDVERAFKLFKRSLSEVGVDPDTNTVDIDIITTGRSHSQFTNLKKVLQIVKQKSLEMDAVPLDLILEESVKEGMDPDKARSYVDELHKKGEIYEVKHGLYKPSQGEGF